MCLLLVEQLLGWPHQCSLRLCAGSRRNAVEKPKLCPLPVAHYRKVPSATISNLRESRAFGTGRSMSLTNMLSVTLAPPSRQIRVSALFNANPRRPNYPSPMVAKWVTKTADGDDAEETPEMRINSSEAIGGGHVHGLPNVGSTGVRERLSTLKAASCCHP